MNGLQGLISVVGLIPELVIVLLSIYYVSQSKTSDAKLLFAGALIGLLARIFFMIVPYLAMQSGDNYSSLAQFYSLGNVVGLIGSVLFCFGLGLLIQRVVVKPKA